MRQIVRSLAQLFPTAIVSGRGREKVKAFVKLKELYYAGSHGMDIAGPQARAAQVVCEPQPSAGVSRIRAQLPTARHRAGSAMRSFSAVLHPVTLPLRRWRGWRPTSSLSSQPRASGRSWTRSTTAL